MPETFALQSSENRRQSPTILNNDRYTPMPYEDSYREKPEIYHIGAKNDPEPTYDDQPYKPSSPVANNSYPSSRNGPELYHLKVADNDNDNYDRRPSPAFITNNRVSPIPDQKSNGQGPEMYFIQVGDNVRQQSPPINDNYQKTKFNDTPRYYNDNDDKPKITVYMLTTDGENLAPLSRIQRTPSPPIRSTKKQKPVSYDIIDNNNRYDVSNKQSPFPTALYDLPISVRHVPLSQSKASESIQRSMNKYRFLGS